MRLNLKIALCLALSLALPASVSRVAAATPNFPPAIQQNLALSAAPDCSICHTDGDQGGKGTVNTPFGKNMRSRGLVEFDVNSLTTALGQMDSEKVNSAGDCLDDIDELKAERNPNLPDPAGTCDDAGAPTPETVSSESPRYGCFGAVAPLRSRPNGLLGLGIVMAIVVAARSRRRGRQR